MQKWDSNSGSMGGKHSWFAVKVRDKWEQQIADALIARNIETFLPVATVRRRWTDRIKTITCALFPGYIFCRIDPAKRMPVLTIPGVHYFVGAGQVPEPVPDLEVESMQALMRSGLPAVARPYFAQGNRVRIWEGPLRGVEGVLLEAPRGLELVISINLLQRSVAVVIDAARVLPLGLETVYVCATPAMQAGGRS